MVNSNVTLCEPAIGNEIAFSAILISLRKRQIAKFARSRPPTVCNCLLNSLSSSCHREQAVRAAKEKKQAKEAKKEKKVEQKAAGKAPKPKAAKAAAPKAPKMKTAGGKR